MTASLEIQLPLFAEIFAEMDKAAALPRYIGRCSSKHCGHTRTVTLKHDQFLSTSGQECPSCHQWTMKFARVQASASNHKCDSRCTHARGHLCECSCAGANHGAAYLG